jgi:hypothetical protein
VSSEGEMNMQGKRKREICDIPADFIFTRSIS